MTKKNLIKFVGIVGLVALVTGCVSTAGALNKEYIKFENSARKSAPKGIIVGVGQATTEGLTPNLARQAAESRARADVARQMNALVKARFVDLENGVEGAAYKGESFQNSITETLTKATLAGVKVREVKTDSSGENFFISIAYDANEAKKLTADAINKSELARNKKAADTAIADMNAAFDREFN
ncbi:MAG: hypothetical protein Ta2G_18760 [Termitinemataceae bacterium]|nr:MAG: hypothetical protein Ta2G_18760 [Termitinemataceae bacterium]